MKCHDYYVKDTEPTRSPKTQLGISDHNITRLLHSIYAFCLRCLIHVRTVFWPPSLQLSVRLPSFTQPPQTGTENRLIFPRGKTGCVNYTNSSAINPFPCFLAICFLTGCHYAIGEATVSLTVYNGGNWFILGYQTQQSSHRMPIIVH